MLWESSSAACTDPTTRFLNFLWRFGKDSRVPLSQQTQLMVSIPIRVFWNKSMSMICRFGMENIDFSRDALREQLGSMSRLSHTLSGLPLKVWKGVQTTVAAATAVNGPNIQRIVFETWSMSMVYRFLYENHRLLQRCSERAARQHARTLPYAFRASFEGLERSRNHCYNGRRTWWSQFSTICLEKPDPWVIYWFFSEMLWESSSAACRDRPTRFLNFL